MSIHYVLYDSYEAKLRMKIINFLLRMILPVACFFIAGLVRNELVIDLTKKFITVKLKKPS